MEKKLYTEEQLKEAIQEAVTEALNNMLNEGITWDAMKAQYKNGKEGDDYDTDALEKDYGEFKNAQAKYSSKQADLRKSWYDPAKKEKAVKGMEDAATDAVAQRPGIIGKGQRQLAKAANKTGQAVKKVQDAYGDKIQQAKDAGTDFLHNKIGI